MVNPANTDRLKIDIENLAKRMERADWWHDYSDDGDVRQRGREEIAELYKDLKTLHGSDPQAVLKLWKEHAPKEWFMPDYLQPSYVERADPITDKQQAYLDSVAQKIGPTMEDRGRDDRAPELERD